MKARNHIDAAAVETVVKCIRKAREERPTEPRRDFRERLGKRRDEANRALQGADEGIAEPITLVVVPVPGQGNVGGRLRPEADGHS